MSTDLKEKTSTDAAARVAHAALRPGARIYFHGDPSELAERVRLSAGTRPAAGCNTDLAGGYADGSYVPCWPWRRASVAELRLLRMDGAAGGGREWRASVDAAIIRIPDELISPLAAMLEERRLREAADPMAYQTIASHPHWRENLAAIDAHLATMCHEPLNFISFRIAEPNRLTLTKGEPGADARKFVGLHLDSWDRLPLRHRDRARNRICINLGREPRYSLFFNLPLMDMFTCIGLRDPDDIYEDFRGLHLPERFMRTWPEYPLIRLRIDPGEAYILPTDNLVHDASTEGNVYPDITLTYLGLFVPAGLPAAAETAAVTRQADPASATAEVDEGSFRR